MDELKKNKHTWKYIDDLKAYYFYRKLKKDTKENRAYLKPFLLNSNKMDSVFMRFRNFENLKTGKALKNTAKKSKQVYDDFKSKSLEDIKLAIIQKEKSTLDQSNFFQKFQPVFKN